MSRPRVVKVPMDGRDVLAVVAQVAVDPSCPECGGPTQLVPGPRGVTRMVVDHFKGCTRLKRRKTAGQRGGR